jgi:hypothetical protein
MDMTIFSTGMNRASMLFSVKLGRNKALFSSRASDTLKPLQLDELKTEGHAERRSERSQAEEQQQYGAESPQHHTA